ncbi:hypothetical protein CANARDRAFT_26327 [[Candida] arabinofermentans NRRL YB-2248]|uniref:Uncharacterized protein n=1 Tax=[Candida] arabinofermentans NRRL YB-2248 TaxID=983967 RepID=A0A1E4T8V2_9ASCO|nr:hypothetical protein CANARDRAFT_26327 [[Candida] arabinofermentans NRRL YB-2248]
MKHPFQKILLNNAGDLLFASSKNSVFVYSLTHTPAFHAKLVGSWTDPVDPMYTLRKQREAKIKVLEEKAKKEETESSLVNDESAPKRQKTEPKLPKLPTPGPGAPPQHTYIRDIHLNRAQDTLLISTDNDKAIVVFKIVQSNKENVLEFVKRQPFPKRPSTISTSVSDKDIIVGDKFGDVYSISIDSDPVDEKNLEPILGHVSMLTAVLNLTDSEGNEYTISTDRDEHIKISHYPKTFLIKKFLHEHEEFVSSIVLPSWCDNKVLVSAGGDKFIFSWDWERSSDELIDKLPIEEYVLSFVNSKHLAPEKFQNEAGDYKEFCVSSIVTIDKLQKLVLIFEQISALFVFDLSSEGEFKYSETIKTSGDIISATSSKDQLIVSIDAEGTKLEIYDITDDGNLKLLNDQQVLSDIYDANTVEVESAENIVPLFTVAGLRKRREH